MFPEVHTYASIATQFGHAPFVEFAEGQHTATCRVWWDLVPPTNFLTRTCPKYRINGYFATHDCTSLEHIRYNKNVSRAIAGALSATSNVGDGQDASATMPLVE